MKNTFKMLINQLFIFLLICGCNIIDSHTGTKYEINNEYIKGKIKIDGFSIAEIKVTSINKNGLPIKEKEVNRYCCELKDGKLKKKIYFDKKNEGYKWFLCTPSFKYMEVDSLKDLTLEDKLARIKKDGSGKTIYYDTKPFEFKKGKWYHLFGLEGIEGSYFLYVNDDGTINVKYFDGGPF
jgi:hypothetical protein